MNCLNLSMGNRLKANHIKGEFMNEEQTLEKTKTITSKEGVGHGKRNILIERKTISILKSDTESIELINSILEKCNCSKFGRPVTLTDVTLYAIRKLKDSDYDLIKESTLTLEERTEKALSEFNQKNGTNMTLIELAMKQLKKEKKETLQ